MVLNLAYSFIPLKKKYDKKGDEPAEARWKH